MRHRLQTGMGTRCSGCSKIGLLNGRSNHLLAPEDTIILAEAVLILQRDAQLPDTAQLQKDLETLSMQHHPIGSVGEQGGCAVSAKPFHRDGLSGQHARLYE